jgi:hypothetical protein
MIRLASKERDGTNAPALRREMERLHGLEDRFLARALVALARNSRADHPAELRGGEGRWHRFPVFFAWSLVPEIAARLGEKVFQPGERRAQVDEAPHRQLREWAYNCLERSPPLPRGRTTPTTPYTAWEALRSNPADGNPVFIALDRLAPVTLDDIGNDRAAAHVFRALLSRGSDASSAMWRP